MSTVPSVYALFISKIIEGALPPELTLESVCARAGLSIDAMRDPQERIPLEKLDRLYEKAAEMVKDQDFGMHAAEKTHHRMFGVVGYTLVSSVNVHEGFDKLLPVLSALQGGEEIEIAIEGKEARFIYRVIGRNPDQGRQRCEAYMTLILRLAQKAINIYTPPYSASFRHSRPKNIREHKRIFGEDIHFNAPVNELAFSVKVLEKPVPTAERELNLVLQRQLDQIAERYRTDELVAAKTRRALREAFLSGAEFSCDAIARSIGLSQRTLQRRLSEEKSSFQELLDAVRYELAISALRKNDAVLNGVAEKLGYSSVSAFYSAFTRWTGSTPANYRKSLRLKGV